MTGLLVTILIIYALVWIVKKSDPSENKKDTLFYVVQDLKDDFLEEIKQLKTRISTLEAEVRQLKGLPAEQNETVKETALESSIISDIEPVKEQVIANNTQFKELYEHVCSVQTEITEQSEITPEKYEEPVLAQKSVQEKRDVESLVTANLFNKIGAVALIIGMGFFLKYAFDQNWISPIVQVLFGFLVAGGLIYGGSYFFKKEDYKNFSQGLAGSGIAISYLSTFAAYNFYHLINYPLALVLMCISTILAFMQSLKYDSVAVAALGLSGGFLTPFVLSSGNADPIGLSTYLLFLNGLVLALQCKKEKWFALGFTSLFATYMIFFTTQIYEHNLIAFVLLWAAYLCFDLFRVSKNKNTAVTTNILNGALFYSGIYSGLDNYSRIIATLLISFVYLSVGIVVYKKYNKPENYLKQNVLASIILLVFATNFGFTGFYKVIALSIEAVAILWLGVKYQKGYIWKSANYLFSLAMITLLFTKQALGYAPLNNFIPVVNLRTLSFAILIGLMALSSNFLGKVENAKSAQEYLKYCWCTLLFILFSVEINDTMTKFALHSVGNSAQLINFNKAMVQVIVWMSYSLQLFRSGLSKKTNAFTVCGMVGFTITAAYLLAKGVTFSPIESFVPIINLRFLAFGVVVSGFIYAANLCKNHSSYDSWLNYAQNVFTYGWCLLLFVLLNCEITDFFAHKTYLLGIMTEGVAFSKNMIFGLVWALYSMPLIKLGLSKKSKALISCGSLSLLLSLLLGIFAGFKFIPIESYTFLFNERMLMFVALIVAFVCITKWLKQSSTDNSMYKYIKTIQITLSLLILFILTIEIKDMFAKQTFLLMSNTSIQANPSIDSLRDLKQLTISGMWLLYSIGLMVWSIIRKIKPVRYIALIILGITILKVFIFDLSFLDQLYRIVSFIGLGVIMLLMSYFYQKYSEQIKKMLEEDELQQVDNN